MTLAVDILVESLRATGVEESAHDQPDSGHGNLPDPITSVSDNEGSLVRDQFESGGNSGGSSSQSSLSSQVVAANPEYAPSSHSSDSGGGE